MMSEWNKCAHEWKVSGGDFDLSREEVVCVKCQCPGERYIKTGEVYWPAT